MTNMSIATNMLDSSINRNMSLIQQNVTDFKNFYQNKIKTKSDKKLQLFNDISKLDYAIAIELKKLDSLQNKDVGIKKMESKK